MTNQREIRTEMAANVWQIAVNTGQVVSRGEELMVLESMKMEIPVVAPCDGTVVSITVESGTTLAQGDLLLTLEES